MWGMSMPGYVPFGSVLEALGAIDPHPVETTRNWDFYAVQYRTPAGHIAAHYLCLSHDCPIQEASPRNIAKWKSLAGGRGFQLVVTTKSRHAENLEKSARQFGA